MGVLSFASFHIFKFHLISSVILSYLPLIATNSSNHPWAHSKPPATPAPAKSSPQNNSKTSTPSLANPERGLYDYDLLESPEKEPSNDESSKRQRRTLTSPPTINTPTPTKGEPSGLALHCFLEIISILNNKHSNCSL